MRILRLCSAVDQLNRSSGSRCLSRLGLCWLQCKPSSWRVGAAWKISRDLSGEANKLRSGYGPGLYIIQEAWCFWVKGTESLVLIKWPLGRTGGPRLVGLMIVRAVRNPNETVRGRRETLKQACKLEAWNVFCLSLQRQRVFEDSCLCFIPSIVVLGLHSLHQVSFVSCQR